MLSRKNFITIAAFMVLLLGSNLANAESNDLLRMDIKRSSMNDAVDVTFYTTGGTTSSVVTRKSDNRYVVLLPNVSGSPGVAPNIGGVKDLITDIDVKSIDDGIGGYTKVTFTTTKPVKIQTTTRKTAPMSQAQQDYKKLLAANNTKPAQPAKPATTANTSAQKPAALKPATTNNAAQTKPVANKTATKPALIPVKPIETKPTTINNIKQAITKTAQNVKPQPKVATQKPEVPAADVKAPEVQKQPTINTANAPKMKFDANGKRVVDLEPRVDHNVVTKNVNNKAQTAESPVQNSSENATLQPASEETVTPVVEEQLQQPQQSQKKLPMIPIAGLASILGIFALGKIMSAIFGKKSDEFKVEPRSYGEEKLEKEEYQDIIEDDSLSWQEKYKRYTQEDSKKNTKSKLPGYSYVTNMGANKKSIASIDDVNSIKNTPKTKEQVLDTVRSQLEHSFNSVEISEPDENNLDVKSEDKAITEKISNAKLKSFAKTKKLNEANRNLLAENKKVVTSPLKESRFVKLRNSALSMSRRNSANSELNISDLLRTGNKYLDNRKNEGLKMDEKKENYVLSSLDEYLTILDSEDKKSEKTSTDIAQAFSALKSNNVMSRSGITNPMEKVNPILKSKLSEQTVNGLVVKSSYNIDGNKGFYLVNLDGISALVGKINDEVFVLKKFDKLIDSPLQVRLDYGSVYIVRVGGFKCLVDVTQDKMGTLLEI